MVSIGPIAPVARSSGAVTRRGRDSAGLHAGVEEGEAVAGQLVREVGERRPQGLRVGIQRPHGVRLDGGPVGGELAGLDAGAGPVGGVGRLAGGLEGQDAGVGGTVTVGELRGEFGGASGLCRTNPSVWPTAGQR